LSKGEKANTIPSKYNLWSKRKIEESDILAQPPRLQKPSKHAENTTKEKKAHNPSSIAKGNFPEVR